MSAETPRQRLTRFVDALAITEGGFIFSLHHTYPDMIDAEFPDAVKALVADLRAVLTTGPDA